MAEDVKCPSCGVIIKITAPEFTFCPVCGASLPELSPSQKLASKNAPKMISLEQALSAKTRSRNSWSLKEMFNLFVLTIVTTLTVRYIFLSFWLQGTQGTELAFDPAFIVVLYLTGIMAGIVPLVYVLYFKMAWEKIGWKRLVHKQWIETIVLGVACGVLIYVLDLVSTSINASIFQATGWSLFSTDSTFQDGYDAFLASNPPWNKLLLVAVLGVQLVISEIFLRGTIVNGASQYQHGKQKNVRSHKTRLVALALSIGLNTLFAFTISIFDVTAVLFAALSNAILGVLFIRAKNVQSCMIAQIVYVILLFIF
jgi:hypothetical protein